MASGRIILQSLVAAWLLLAALAPPAAAEHGRPAAQDMLVAKNDTFELYANEATLAIRVVDKRSGYEWHSNLPEVTDEDDLNRTWTAFATSGISIDYLDERAVDNRASITNAEHTLDFRRTQDGFEADVTFVEPAISLQLRVALEPAGVRVEVPFASVREADIYKLGLLHLYPFFGATREDEVPGYMFIPDGAGSLIRFAATTKARNMFYGRYYGVDLGMLGSLPFDPTSNRPYRLSVPVSGMVHGEGLHGYLAVVENGAAYGQLQVHPAGVTTRFNFLYSGFIYNQSYFQATNRAGAGVTTIQPRPNAFDVTVHYRFLTGAESSYTGLARSYQQYLVERGRLADVAEPGGDIGVRLEFLGGEKERVLFWQRFIPMTTMSQMAAILNALQVANPDVIYYGWQPLGANAMPPRRLRLENDLGSLNELRELAQAVEARGGNFYLYLDPQAALMDQPGYSPRNDVARAITGVNLVGDNRQKVNFYLTLREMRSRFAGLSEDVFEAGAGLALDGISSTLYSDFRRGSLLGREEAITAYQGLLGEHPGPTAFYAPNDYLYGFMQAYYDVPLSSSGYLYATEAVPFLQTVLSGYVPAYGPALNFSADMQADLLRHVDYNVYPSFFLSHETTDKILRTSSNWIYTSAHTQWSPEVERVYAWLNDRLGPVKGQPIVAREQLAPEVFATTYGNGQQIIVNYGTQPFRDGADVVEARDAIIREAP